MHLFRHLFLTCALLTLAACATGPDLSNPQVRAAIARVKDYNSVRLPRSRYRVLKNVQSKICLTNAASSANSSEEAAKTELKYLAAQAGANGIMNLMCNSSGMDMGSNCWKASTCYADAILVR